MTDTARLHLPRLAPAQAQKHVTVNEALDRLDALVQARVESRFAAVPPADPPEGAAWIVPEGAGAAFAGQDGRLAQRLAGGWVFHAPGEGWLVFVADEGRFVVRVGSDWRDLAEAAVWYPAGAGVQAKLNRPGPDDTAALLLQTGWSGRAEIGLSPTDDLTVKVSADGAVWQEALSVDRATGEARFARGALRMETLVFTQSGPFLPPPWCRSVDVVAVGAGGGGASGRRRPASFDRRGGGGGGAGGLVQARFAVGSLPSALWVEVGAGGQGGPAALMDDTDGANGTVGGSSGLRAGADWIVEARGGGGGAAPKGSVAAGGAGGSGAFGPGGAGGAGGTSSGLSAPEPALGIVPGGGGGGGGVASGGTSGPGGSGSGGSLSTGSGTRAAPGGTGGMQAGESGAAGSAGGFVGGCGGGGGGGAGGAGAGSVGGGAGGNGGEPGGGGGGGGSSANGSPSGAGGSGAPGAVVLVLSG